MLEADGLTILSPINPVTPRRTHRPVRNIIHVRSAPGAKLTTYARKTYLQLLRSEPTRPRIFAALRGLNHDIPPPASA